MAFHSLTIDQGWQFRQADAEETSGLGEWRAVRQFPTNVHLDLLAHKLIPDPFVGKNEAAVQWIGERRWVYRAAFATPSPSSAARATPVLALDGLDTFATVVLNGHTVLESDNMFLPHRVDVSAALSPAGGENTLEITFDSAFLRGWQLVDQYPDHKWGCWNGDNSRLAVRKAQYHWGWDWGPALLTCGPWRPIRLETYSSRIADLSCETVVDTSLQSAAVTARVEIETFGPAPAAPPRVRIDVSLNGVAVASATAAAVSSVSSYSTVTTTTAAASFHISSPALWYPARYGEQPLYTVKATLLAGHTDEAAHEVSKKIGLRRAELVQHPLKDQPGTSFFFKINNIPVFAGGSNWIPADSFIPRIGDRRYYDWVKLALDGNQIMIRVWGGGIYEEQALYDACDELGVLVWQDFMFGCGNYPAWPALRESIRREAEANVRLLRHHPSIVIWAGNNEDYQYREEQNLEYDYANKDAESWLSTDFPARYIYEKILADVCASLIPDTYYHYGSPWGGGVDTHDPTVGDIHQWNVWHGTQERYQDFDKLVGRFVSEFGMEAFPHIKTVDAMLPLGRRDPDRYAQSATLDFHNKATGHERRLALYLVENIRYGPDPLEQYVYATQLMQAECLASAYRLWKRQWQGPGREYCGGALVWQLNDCWPVTSWSICDYYLRPKHAYFTVKREMAPLTVGMTRRATETVVGSNPHSRADVETETTIEVWGSNLTVEHVARVDCVVRAWDVETGRQTYEKTVAAGVALEKNRSTELAAFPVPGVPGQEARTVVAAYLERDGAQLARYVNWPEPLKYLHLPTPQDLSVSLSADGTGVEIRAGVPVKGVAIEIEDDEDEDAEDAVKFDDNLVDIVPGETVTIGVRGATSATKFKARYLQ